MVKKCINGVDVHLRLNFDRFWVAIYRFLSCFLMSVRFSIKHVRQTLNDRFIPSLRKHLYKSRINNPETLLRPLPSLRVQNIVRGPVTRQREPKKRGSTFFRFPAPSRFLVAIVVTRFDFRPYASSKSEFDFYTRTKYVDVELDKFDRSLYGARTR